MIYRAHRWFPTFAGEFDAGSSRWPTGNHLAFMTARIRSTGELMSGINESVQESRYTRRQITLNAALALLGGCLITISDGCGSESPTTPTTAATPVADVTGGISANHGHTAVVTGAQITAAGAVALSIQGTAAHNHTLSLSQADLQTLKNRQTVTHDSTSDASAFGVHLHTVT